MRVEGMSYGGAKLPFTLYHGMGCMAKIKTKISRFQVTSREC